MFHSEVLPAEHKVVVEKRSPPTRSELSTDQRQAFDTLTKWAEARMGSKTNDYVTLGGLAGTGKTTILATLADSFQLGRGPSVVFTAFTGKAVDVLKRKLASYGIDAPCKTLHSLMYKPQTDKAGNVIGWEHKRELGTWYEDEYGQMRCDTYDLVVLDEASMVNAELWKDLRSYDVPIIAVGDHGQLPPVGTGAINLLEKPHMRLEKIHRQAADNPIISLAHGVRADGVNAIFKYKNTEDTRVRRMRFEQALDIIALGGLDAAGICYKNATRTRLNMLIHDRVVHHKGDDANDIVICLRNFEGELFNGMRGILRSVDGEPDKLNRCWMTVDFPENDMRCKVQVQLSQFGRPTGIQLSDVPNAKRWDEIGLLFDYGYVVTCHKAQGSQWSDVVVQYETTQKDTEEVRRRWLYTAITRASERLVIST